jgi:endoglucanase
MAYLISALHHRNDASRPSSTLARVVVRRAIASSATILFGLALVAAPLSAAADETYPRPEGGLAVRVSGHHLVNGDGEPIRLLGVNRSGTEYSCIAGWGFFDGPGDDASVAAMASWHINAVRVPLNEDCWLGINGVDPAYSGANYANAMVSWVNLLHRHNLYAILNLHWNAPGTQLATGQQPMADADHSPAFWQSVASTFKNDPAVIFDLFNEPHGITWTCLRDGCNSLGWQSAGMQSLVDAVRGTGAAQPLMIAGLDWTNDLSQWLQYAPADPYHALVASYHLYNWNPCSSVDCWNSTLIPVAQRVPLVTGELGENDCAHGFIDSYMAWADAHRVSYVAWAWNTASCEAEPALITAYDGTPTSFGIGFRDHLLAINSSESKGGHETD